MLSNHMKMEQLEYFGIPSYLIHIWKEYYSSELLPVQEMAIRQFGLFRNLTSQNRIFAKKNKLTKNLLVVSPTSSGKTLVAEIAALHEITFHKKVIYLVPLRVLGEEKYQHFVRLYQPTGLKVKLSSRDHRQDDREIIHGHFHIAIIVYEKFYYLLLQYPTFLQNVNLLIADEIQLLYDHQRGPRLENCIQYFIHNHPSVPIIALSAYLKDMDQLANWLKASVLFSHYRPVELRKGIVRHGIFEYVEHNTKIKGKEIFFPDDTSCECDLAGYLKTTLLYLLRQNESTLIFFSTKKETRLWAKWLAGELSLSPADKIISQFKTLENSTSREELTTILQNGIAYHCSDLSWPERHLIEEAVRNHGLKIICATGTLSMGINLPVTNVILTGQKTISCQKDDHGSTFYYQKALTLSEIENMGGRAGRIEQQKKFGRMIFLAPSLIEYSTYKKLYFNNWLEKTLQPHLPELSDRKSLNSFQLQEEIIPSSDNLIQYNQHLSTFLLTRIVFYGQNMADLFSLVCNREINPDILWQYQFKKKWTENEIWENINTLEKGNIIQKVGQSSFLATELGRFIVSKGISLTTFFHLKKWIEQKQEKEISEPEILFLIAQCQDIEDIPPFYSFRGKATSLINKQKEYLRMRLLNLIFEQGEEQKQIFQSFHPLYQENQGIQKNKEIQKIFSAIKKTLLMLDWINGRELREIEEEYGILYGTIQKMGENFSWLTDTLASIPEFLKQDRAEMIDLKKIREIGIRLIAGVEPEGVSLAQLNIPGLTRGYIQRLVQEGYNNKECLKELTEEQLKPLLPDLLIQKIKKSLLSSESREKNIPHYKDNQKNNPKRENTTNSSQKSESDQLNFSPAIQIDKDRPDRILFLNEEIPVNKINYQLISFLLENQERIVTYDEIISVLWPEDEDATYHRLWYHLGQLRNKIKFILKNKQISLSPDQLIKEKLLKVFPGRGLLLDVKMNITKTKRSQNLESKKKIL